MCRRAGGLDLLEFVERVKSLGRRHKLSHSKLLSIWLHGPKPTDIPLGEIQWIRNELAEEGVESTPKQVRRTMERALCKVRNALRELGWSEAEIPDSDLELRSCILGGRYGGAIDW